MGRTSFPPGRLVEPQAVYLCTQNRILLLYALVTDQTFYALNVYSHQSFEDPRVLDSIHRNWPEEISRYRVNGVTGGAWNQAQRRAFRNKNANVFVTTADGTVYMPISGGVMASGVSWEAVRLSDFWQIQIHELQSSFEKQLESLLPTLKNQGFDGEEELEAEFKIFPSGVQVFIPKYRVLAKVTYETRVL